MDDRPFAVLSTVEAHRQLLPHRSVVVLTYDENGRLLLRKRGADGTFPGRWDVSAGGHVLPGESREDAAQREIGEKLGLRAGQLTLAYELRGKPETGLEFLSVYIAGRLNGMTRVSAGTVPENMYADRDEMNYLAENYRELLAPRIVYCWEKGLLFPVL